MNVDLRKCKGGDVLIDAKGNIILYDGPVKKCGCSYHKIIYVGQNNGFGTRTDEGYFFNDNIVDSDYNIVLIPKNHIGWPIEFEYNGTYDINIITTDLIEAFKSGKFKNCRIKKPVYMENNSNTCPICGTYIIESANSCNGCGYIPKNIITGVRKPPLGVMPRNLHDESRLRDLQGAISRAYSAEYEIKEEWIREYNELIYRLGTRKK